MPEPPSLRQLQQQLFALFRAPDGVEAALDSIGLSELELCQVVEGDARLSGLGRVGIYADMYFLRLRDVLRETFPKLAAALGDERFSAVVADYLQAHPSRHPSLRYLGQHLPAFLAASRERRPPSPELPAWAADLAALEWHRYDVFDAEDVPLLTLESLRGLAADGFGALSIQLATCCRILPVQHAVEAVWRTLRDEAPVADVSQRSHSLLVWRQGLTVYHRPLEPLEAGVLELAEDGTTVAAICERVATDLAGGDAVAAQTAFGLIGRWVTDELLVAPSAPG